MKLSSVGLDNLPNTYIENITISDASSSSESGLVAELEVSVHDSVNMHWSADPLLLKFIKIVVVQSTSILLSSDLSSGSQTLDPASLVHNAFYSSSDATFKVIDIKGMMNPEHSKDIEGNDIIIYRYKTRFSMRSKPSHLNYYVATYIDIQAAMATFNVNASIQNTLPFIGPVASDSVLSNGELVDKSTIFTLPDGDVWNGPVHMHSEGGYMVGSQHMSTPHPRLTTVEVQNTKIKQLSSSVYGSKKTSEETMNGAFISELWISRKKDGTNRCLFMIDMERFIAKKTKHGRALMNLDKDLYDSFIRTIKIKKLTIERYRVTRGTVNKRKKQEIVVSQDDNTGRLIGKLLMNKRGERLQIPLKDINVNKRQMKNGDSVHDYLYDGTIKELYLFGNNIRSFEFADHSAARGGNSDAAYSVSIKMVDRSTVFVKNILNTMTTVYNQFQNYLESAGSLRNYDFKLNQLKPSFVREQNESYAIDSEFNRIKQSPWILGPETYVKYLAMIRDISPEESIRMKQKLYGMVNPTDFKIRNARKFSRDFRALIAKYIEFFDIKGVSLARTSSKKTAKSSKQNRMIEHSSMFKEIYTMREDRMYDFFGQHKKNPGMRRVGRLDYDKRISEETSNYTSSGYSTGGDAGNIDTAAARALADISSNRNSFLTPSRLVGKKNSKDISFKKMRNTKNKEKVNDFMNKKSPPMALRTRVLPAGLTKPSPDQSENENTKEEIEDKFLDAKFALGTESPFTQFDGSVLPPDVANAVLTLNEKNEARVSVLNRLNFEKIKTTSSFDLTSERNKISPLLNKPDKQKMKQKLKGIPTQVKSLFFRRSKASSNELLTDDMDVLEHPETANIAELNFMTIQKIEFLEGFRENMKGKIQINKPVWTLLTTENYQQALDNVSLCRMSYYEDEELDISIDSEKKLPVLDQYFILSNETADANQRKETDAAVTDTTDTMANTYIEENMYDIKYATSNIVRQPTNNSGIASEPLMGTETTTATTASPATAMAPTTAMSSPSPSMGGSGY